MNSCLLPYRTLPIGSNGRHVILDIEDWCWAKYFHWIERYTQKANWRKYYAARQLRVGGRRTEIWLHKEILLLKDGPPPSPAHHIGDHRDGESLNCRRNNLRWATDQMNSTNRYGIEVRQFSLDL